MSLDVVSQKLEVLKTLPVVKEEHIADVIVAAERSQKGRSDGVSNAEARAVVDFYLSSVAKGPKPLKVAAPPFEHSAKTRLNAFFVAHNIPFGDNKGPMKDRVLGAYAPDNKGMPLARPPRIGSLQPLHLDGEGAARRVAYVDIVKNSFFVKEPQGEFYGPFSLDAGRSTSHAA